MQFYRSPARRPLRDAADETLLDQLGEPAGVNVRVIAHDGVHEAHPSSSGLRGLGFLVAFKAGVLHTVEMTIRPGTARRLRFEVHGRATRMQKGVATIAVDGSLVSAAEEITDIESHPEADGSVRVTMGFVPFRSLVEWFYVFSADDEADVAGAALFGVAGFKVYQAQTPPRFRSMAHLQATNHAGILYAVQNLIVLRNYVHLQIEVHKPGARLTGLDARCPFKVAHAQWWTWDPGHGMTGVLRHEDGTVPLVARKPGTPVPSPALMDLFGAPFAHQGHAITLLLADLPDFASMGVEAADRVRQIIVCARFDDGTSREIDVAGYFSKGESNPWIDLTLQHLAALAMEQGKKLPFLEMGARGVASLEMRQTVSAAGWRYLGVDILAQANVDIVADAHDLGAAVAAGSVAAVYSSEVMEHLLSPIHFVVEANRVLAEGGLFIARAPTTWPLHAEPWDFWRFSQHGWQGLLNANTGFEIGRAHV